MVHYENNVMRHSGVSRMVKWALRLVVNVLQGCTGGCGVAKDGMRMTLLGLHPSRNSITSNQDMGVMKGAGVGGVADSHPEV